MKGTKKGHKKLKRWIIRILLLLILAAVGFFAYQSLKTEYTVNYDSYTATVGSISNSLSFSGNLALIDSESYMASSEATVKKVYVEVGDDVKDGDKIMRLSNGETIESSIDGTVNTLNFEVGDDVAMGDNLGQVVDFTHLKATFRVDEYDISEVEVGQTCKVTVTALERTFETTVAAINHTSSSGGSVAYYTATVYVDVDEGVYPGMQITISIPQESAENVIILKEDALSFDSTNSAFVYMYGEDGVTLEQVEVEVGVSNGNYVEIKSGLEDGDEVFVESQVDESSSGSLLSSLFGSTNMNMPSGGGMGGGDFSGFSGGDMSSMRDSSSGGGFSGGSMPSGGGRGQ